MDRRQLLIPRAWVRRIALTATGLLGLAAGGAYIVMTTTGYAAPGAVRVPTQYLAPITQAATSCPALTPARLAGQIMEESAFKPDAANGRGGRGLSGLTNADWEMWRPSADSVRLDPAAEIHALAHRICDLVGHLRQANVPGDLWEPAVAAAFTDVASFGSAAAHVPSAARDYVDRVVSYAAQYERAPNLAPESVPPIALAGPSPSSTVGPTSNSTVDPGLTSTVDPASSPTPRPTPGSAVATPNGTASTTVKANSTVGPPRTTQPVSRDTDPLTVGALVNPEFGCLSATAALDGTHLSVARCDGSLLQQWQIRNDGRMQSVGLCMDSANAGTDDWNPVQVAYCSANAAQLYTLDESGHLYSPYAAKCVNVHRDPNAGTSVVLHSCLNQTNQYFTLTA
jgi:hypothetical protein